MYLTQPLFSIYFAYKVKFYVDARLFHVNFFMFHVNFFILNDALTWVASQAKESLKSNRMGRSSVLSIHSIAAVCCLFFYSSSLT